ncbi:MAG TPA: enoyl-ACP reductase FabV [Spirochaetia bacterium]|nr:enoyl-ACP reductase FabV [Spirochaetia bacterium]
MIIKPMIRSNICMNAHPDGCAAYVAREIAYVRSKGKIANAPKRVLVVGASTGYGLSSRITAAFAGDAGTIGVAFEREGSEKRTGTAGFYNTVAFEAEASKAGLVAESINGDAFSHEIKKDVIARIKRLFGSVDLVVYSLASAVRTDPDSGEMYRSVLKPIGRGYTIKSIDPMAGEVREVSAEAASEEEIRHTVKVMGGEDWELWIRALLSAGVLAPGARTVAYSYIGPELMAAIYREGTIGRAKVDLESTAARLTAMMAEIQGRAWVSVNKALVTRASAVIPAVPLYLALLFKIMKQKGTHEECIQQMYRLFKERLYGGTPVPVDEKGRIRIDDWELRDEVQSEITRLWPKASTENITELGDLDQYRTDFLQMHGFGFDSVDYEKEVEP